MIMAPHWYDIGGTLRVEEAIKEVPGILNAFNGPPFIDWRPNDWTSNKPRAPRLYAQSPRLSTMDFKRLQYLIAVKVGRFSTEALFIFPCTKILPGSERRKSKAGTGWTFSVSLRDTTSGYHRCVKYRGWLLGVLLYTGYACPGKTHEHRF
jgi:hypothetical protein